MFLLNSRFSLFNVNKLSILVPKLQIKFAEFLQYTSLERLNILYQKTCGGLSTVCIKQAFSRKTIKSFCHYTLIPLICTIVINLRGRFIINSILFKCYRKPLIFGDNVFYIILRYSCQNIHFYYLQIFLKILFQYIERSATLFLEIIIVVLRSNCGN